MSRSNSRRRATAVLATLGMIGATLAAVLSFAAPASAGVGSNLYELTCDQDVVVGGSVVANVGPAPTPIVISSTEITPIDGDSVTDAGDGTPGSDPTGDSTPALPQGADVRVTGNVTLTVSGAVQGGALSNGLAVGSLSMNPSTLNIEATPAGSGTQTVPFTLPGGALEGDAQAINGFAFNFDATSGTNVVTATTPAFAPYLDDLGPGSSSLDGLAFSAAQPASGPPEISPTATVVSVDSDTQITVSENFTLDVTGGRGAGIADNSTFTYVGVDLGTFQTNGADGDTMEFSLGDGGTIDIQIGLLGFQGNDTSGAGGGCAVTTGSVPGSADAPFGTKDLVAPPGPPVCSNTSASVGLGQSVDIDLVALCVDQNGDLDPSTFLVSTPAGNGGVNIVGGVATYSSATDPGPGGDSFGFTVDDLAGNGPSVEATVTVNVLANLCDATAGPCSLTQVVTFTVNGAQRTMEQTGQFVALSDITLNGDPQVATGSLNDIEVLNARGDAAGWTVSAYSTDYGTAGAPTIPTPAGDVYDCSAASAAIGGAGAPDFQCIPGANMGWAPTASVAHAQIPGDVAAVTAGPASAADAAAWLAQLETGSNAGGLAGYDAALGAPQNVLCSAPAEQSGGTFACDADLFLGVPASTGAGLYDGAIILTLT